jgi:hypothetical protein
VVEAEASVRVDQSPRAVWQIIDLETGEILDESQDRPEWAGAKRKAVTGWTAASRRRFLRMAAALDFEAVENDWGGRFMFVTLTYRNDPGPRNFKRHLHHFQVALRRYMGQLYNAPLLGVWKMEFQDRGVVHAHLLVWLPSREDADRSALRYWLWDAWHVITGGYEVRPGMRASRLKGGRGMNRVDADWCYARDRARYIVADFTRHSKAYQFRLPPSWEGGAGRWWGSWGLKPQWLERHVSFDEYVWAVRLLRRHREANSRRKVRFGSGGTRRIWVVGDQTNSLSLQLERALRLLC